jgi:hypothetical protein
LQRICLILKRAHITIMLSALGPPARSNHHPDDFFDLGQSMRGLELDVGRSVPSTGEVNFASFKAPDERA